MIECVGTDAGLTGKERGGRHAERSALLVSSRAAFSPGLASVLRERYSTLRQ